MARIYSPYSEWGQTHCHRPGAEQSYHCFGRDLYVRQGARLPDRPDCEVSSRRSAFHREVPVIILSTSPLCSRRCIVLFSWTWSAVENVLVQQKSSVGKYWAIIIAWCDGMACKMDTYVDTCMVNVYMPAYLQSYITRACKHMCMHARLPTYICRYLLGTISHNLNGHKKGLDSFLAFRKYSRESMEKV